MNPDPLQLEETAGPDPLTRSRRASGIAGAAAVLALVGITVVAGNAHQNVAPAAAAAPQLPNAITVLWCPEGLTTESACPTGGVPSPSASTTATPSPSAGPTPTPTPSTTPTPTPSPSPTSTPTAPPTPTASPTAIPTAPATPTPTAAPTTPPGSTVTPPSSVKCDGTTDTGAALQAWLLSLSGQGKTADLGGKTCVVGSGQLALGGLRSTGITNGTLRFSKFTSTPAILLDRSASGITLTNLTLIGSSPTPGKSAGESSEHNHAIAIQGAQNTVLDRLTISKFGGDCVYSGGFSAGTWSKGLRFTNSTCTDMGRMGVAVADGLSDALIENVTFDRFGWYATFDLEPNCVKVGNPLTAAAYERITFRGNHIGRGNSAKYAFVATKASCSGGSEGPVTASVATGNRTMYPDYPWNFVNAYPAGFTLSDNR